MQRRAFTAVLNRIPSCGFRSLSSSAAPKRVGTHDGKFHCDEALGCFMIRRTAKFHDADIVRSRDPLVLDKLDAVLDVGGVYDPSRDRYDHHQKGFEEVFGCGYVTKLSSAGLVYKAVDAIDNGISQYNTTQLPRFVNNTSLSLRVERLNPDGICPNQSLAKEDESFQQAMKVAGNEFLECINFHAKSWLPARSIVINSLLARKSIDSSGEIIMLTNSVPWKLHIFELEKELKITPIIKYVVYADDRSEKWRLQAVAVGPDKFDSRKPLPLSWRGLNDDELSQASGIGGCTFVHISGFIGGNRTYDGALAMARTSLMLA
ncbi:MYG1 protein-like isoform X2 [Salvia divinorum]|uniref:MYG1 protein-like isoform X2 n=1 Tax=Salvia divinorum TaxID=28513 RepID=A0ABD1H9N4_SALDI